MPEPLLGVYRTALATPALLKYLYGAVTPEQLKMVLPVIKTNNIDIFSEIQNLEAHLNCFIASKVTAILLNGRILPTGGVAFGLFIYKY